MATTRPKDTAGDDEAQGPVVSAPEPTSVAAPQSTKVAERVPVDHLRTNAYELLGIESHVLAGALYGYSESEITLDQARTRVESWLKAPAE